MLMQTLHFEIKYNLITIIISDATVFQFEGQFGFFVFFNTKSQFWCKQNILFKTVVNQLGYWTRIFKTGFRSFQTKYNTKNVF